MKAFRGIEWSTLGNNGAVKRPPVSIPISTACPAKWYKCNIKFDALVKQSR